MSILRTDLTPRRKSLCGSTPRVHFALPADVKNIILNFLDGQDKDAYYELIAAMKEPNNSDENVLNLLRNCYGIINSLDQRVYSFVISLISMNWNSSSDNLASTFQQFLLELVASHNYYTKPVLENLLKRLCGTGEAWADSKPSVEENITFQRVHEAIKQVLKIIPLAADMLLEAANTCFPFMKRGAKANQSYVYNLLRISEYQPLMRQQLLALIINKTISIDVHIPRHVLEAMDEEGDMETDEKMDDSATVFTMDDVSRSASKYSNQSCNEFELAHTLDILMEQLYCYIRDFCALDVEPSSWNHHRTIFKELLDIFETQMLLVHGSHHVQFFVFFLCSLRPPTFAELFLSSLWSKVTRLSETSVIRQAATFYISSLLARAQFVSPKMMRCMLAQMAEWCHSYVAAQEEASGCDVKSHAVFYAVCQGLFYVVAFRHADLVNSAKGLLWTQSLGLAKLVNSRLNPLKPCLPAVAQNFASVTRTYQIAYCFTVMERNARNHLPVIDQSGQKLVTNLSSFFPFDPYLLSRSSPFILPLYREYEALEQPGDALSDSEDDSACGEKIHLRNRHPSLKSMSPGSLTHICPSPKSFTEMFSYGSSPGFKHY